MKKDTYFMKRALEEAIKAYELGEVPVGAVLVDERGRIIASTHNKTITLCDPTAHAEILALRAGSEFLGNYRLLGSTLYVTLEPCIMCAGALVNARIKRLVFGAWDEKAGACGSLYDIVRDERLNHTLEVRGGILEEESKALLRKFFKERRNC